MSLKHIKCNIFFVIGCLSLMALINCNTNDNSLSKIELKDTSSSIQSENYPQNQSLTVLEIDDSALAELDLWTAFFVLQKEVLKLEENKPNAFEDKEQNIGVFFKDLTRNIPKLFDTNTIWARLKVLETEVFLYHAYANAEVDDEHVSTARLNVLLAYYNLVRQINKLHEKETQNINE